MRIGFFFGSGDFTGACRMGYHFARSFRDSGSTVECVCGRTAPGENQGVAEKLREEGFAVWEDGNFRKGIDSGLVRRMAALARARKWDLIVSMVQLDTKIAGLAAMRAGVPFVVSAQSVTTFYGALPVRWLKNWLYGWILRRSAELVVCTGEVVREHYQKVHGFCDSKICVIPNGIETNACLPNGRTTFLGEKSVGAFNLLNVGRLDPQKGQHQLLDAILELEGEISSLSVWLVGGETVSSEESRTYANSLRERVKSTRGLGAVSFLGWREDIPELLRGTDVYVHASLWEGPPLPLAVIEAMACGRPVVFTDCAGWPDGFEQGVHGIIVKKGDSAELAKGILALYKLPAEQRAKMGVAARKLVETRYDVAIIGRQFAEAVGKVALRTKPTEPRGGKWR